MSRTVIVATVMRPSGETGVQTHFRAFAAWLQARGRACVLLTPFSAPMAVVAPLFGLRRLIDPLHGPSSVWWYRHWHAALLRGMLTRHLADGAPCTVYAQCPLCAEAALAARRGPRQRVVLVVHFNVSQADEWAGKGRIAADGPMARAIRAMEARVLPAVDGLVCVSAFMRDELRRRVPAVAAVPTAVIPNFVDDPGPVTREALDADLLCVGTLEPRKNQLYALEIVAAARDLGRPLTLTIIGDGPDRTRLEQHAQALGIGGQVRFAGYVRGAGTAFARHRACLHVATMENLPLTLVEALARATPVFAVPVGGVPEVVTDGVEGRHLPAADATAAARRILEWFDEPGRLDGAATAARQRFLADFASDVAAARLLAFLDADAAAAA
jgi:glycosyltransferase involved in cell wall biosynthesis